MNKKLLTAVFILLILAIDVYVTVRERRTESIKINSNVVYDETTKTYYYSYNDQVPIRITENITSDKIKDNYTFRYNNQDLKITTLPIMNIIKDEEYEYKISNINVDIFYDFNNYKGYLTILDNKNYELDFNNKKYYLNSMSDDKELIRNIFSNNLWGKKYKYIELFINGEYSGIYTLGYRDIDKLNDQEYVFYKSSPSNTEADYTFLGKMEGYILYDKDFKRVTKDNPDDNLFIAWERLKEYYSAFENKDDLVGKVSSSSIDIYLYYLLIQAENSNKNGTFYNTYLAYRKTDNSYRIEYIPGNITNTFNYNNTSSNNTFIMKYNPTSRLIELNDDKTISKVKDRYSELRRGDWSDYNINKMIDEYEDQLILSGTLKRNHSNLTNLDTFREYVNNRLKSLDQYINSL